jgi:hypothetical protein
MTYLGWAADVFPELRGRITAGTQTFSVAGVVDAADIPAITDPRFPGRPAYGPNDVTTALEFQLNPSATTAQLVLALGGAPSAQQLPTPDGPGNPSEVPEPGTLGLLGAGASLLIFRRFRAQSCAKWS